MKRVLMRLGLFALILGWVPFTLSVAVHAQSRDERAVRAAYVFNLTKYVEWPAELQELNICLLGTHAAGDTFQKMLDGKVSESRPIRVLLSPAEQELGKCNVVYVPGAGKARETLNKLDARKALTVGESDSFTAEGGMVGLVRVGDQIEIQINVEAAQRGDVKISSRLLSLAHLVGPPTDARK